jgi:hypothetical protein
VLPSAMPAHQAVRQYASHLQSGVASALFFPCAEPSVLQRRKIRERLIAKEVCALDFLLEHKDVHHSLFQVLRKDISPVHSVTMQFSN